MKRTGALALSILLIIGTPALADTVVLRDGRKVVGNVSFEKNEVVVKQKLGEVRVARAEVERIDTDDDFSELARQKDKLANGSAEDRYRLGVWCRDHGFQDDARAAFQSVLALDPDHAGARAALGYAKIDGRWVSEDDAMRARGLVKLGDRWVTPAEKALADTLAEEKRRAAEERARKAEEERVAARKARADAEAKARDERIRAYDLELAKARARQRAEDEASEGFTSYTGYVGPYGPYCGLPYSYWVGPVPSTNDLLAWRAVQSGAYPYPTAARPTAGRVVTVRSGPAPCWGTPAMSGSYWGWGVGVSGSYTKGGFSIRFRF